MIRGQQRFFTLFVFIVTVIAFPISASAWNPLRSNNSDVERGNALLAEGKTADALKAYEAAAPKLLRSAGLAMNEGLAHLMASDFATAQEKLDQASQAEDKITRADALYNLGLAMALQADADAAAEDHKAAADKFSEAADAFKRSLRARPGNKKAAWNYEYTKRMMNKEREEHKKEEDQQKENEEKQDQQQDQNSDPQDKDGQDQDKQNQEEEKKDQSQEEQKQGQPDESESQEEQKQPQPKQKEVDQFLDALEKNEKNLPLQRARRRGAMRRPPAKDW